MSDYNQSLSVAEASRRAAALEDEGLYWIEEPTRADDYSGHAQIRRDTKTPVQIGENWWGPHDAAKSIEVGAEWGVSISHGHPPPPVVESIPQI